VLCQPCGKSPLRGGYWCAEDDNSSDDDDLDLGGEVVDHRKTEQGTMQYKVMHSVKKNASALDDEHLNWLSFCPVGKSEHVSRTLHVHMLLVFLTPVLTSSGVSPVAVCMPLPVECQRLLLLWFFDAMLDSSFVEWVWEVCARVCLCLCSSVGDLFQVLAA
jgi:hypothetical protein